MKVLSLNEIMYPREVLDLQNKLAELRKERNMSQKEFSKIFNVAQNTISQWEQGKRNMDTESLLKLADFFQVTTDYLLGRSEAALRPANTFVLSASEEMMVKKYRTLPPLSQETVDTVLESLYLKEQACRQKKNTAS
jgi:transcriptional regulator with XRE-family HTH domain